MTYEFTIPGCPVPWQRARYSSKSKRFFTAKETRAYQSKVRAVAKLSGVEPIDGRVGMRLEIFFPDYRVRDDDNVEKTIRDALQTGRGRFPVAFDNDACVKEVHRYVKVDSLNPRVEVVLWALDGEP